MVAKIATGEVEDNAMAPDKAHHIRGGKAGEAARAAKLTSEERSTIARLAASRRWAAKVEQRHSKSTRDVFELPLTLMVFNDVSRRITGKKPNERLAPMGV